MNKLVIQKYLDKIDIWKFTKIFWLSKSLVLALFLNFWEYFKILRIFCAKNNKYLILILINKYNIISRIRHVLIIHDSYQIGGKESILMTHSPPTLFMLWFAFRIWMFFPFWPKNIGFNLIKFEGINWWRMEWSGVEWNGDLTNFNSNLL